MDGFQDKVAFIWSIAELLRGDYKQSEYGKVVLPLTVLRRLDSVLEPTKAEVLKRHEELPGRPENGGSGRHRRRDRAPALHRRAVGGPAP